MSDPELPDLKPVLNRGVVRILMDNQWWLVHAMEFKRPPTVGPATFKIQNGPARKTLSLARMNPDLLRDLVAFVNEDKEGSIFQIYLNKVGGGVDPSWAIGEVERVADPRYG